MNVAARRDGPSHVVNRPVAGAKISGTSGSYVDSLRAGGDQRTASGSVVEVGYQRR